MSDALLPCPFCGSNSVMWNPVELSTGVYDDSRGFVDCISCSIRTEGKTAKDVAFAAWNRRPAAALEQAQAEGERLRGELARTERNRDMWKGQCELQADDLRKLRGEP